MVVTSCTVHRQTDKVIHHVRQHVVAIEIATNLAINRIFANIPQGALIPRPAAIKNQGRRCVQFVPKLERRQRSGR